MNDKYLIRYETYDKDRIKRLCEDTKIGGIVMGDLFCKKRMYPNGFVDEIFFVKQVLDSDKELIYQAPLYVTSRNIDEVISILNFIKESKKDCAVIVQDFGTAELIRREYSKLRLIWGQLGRVREKRFSDEFLQFLVEREFYGMETSDTGLAKRLIMKGLIPYIGNAVLQYQTVGRNCYLQYEADICDPKACLDGCYSLKGEDNSIEMTIDGFMLGKRLQHLSNDKFEEMIHKCHGIPLVYET